MPQFLDANFGSYSLCNQSWPMGKDMADYAQTIALTPQKVLTIRDCTQRPTGKSSQTSENIWPASQNKAISSDSRSYRLGFVLA